MLSVELLLDEESERVVRRDWSRLGDAGLPSAGRNPAPSNRPHVTIAVRDELDPHGFDAVGRMLPVPMELGGILVFGHRDRFILTRQVVVTPELLELHRRAAELAGAPGPRYANTAPGRWTPHVTLARRLETTQVGIALRAIRAPQRVGQATGLRVWNAVTRTVTTVV